MSEYLVIIFIAAVSTLFGLLTGLILGFVVGRDEK